MCVLVRVSVCVCLCAYVYLCARLCVCVCVYQLVIWTKILLLFETSVMAKKEI